MSTDIDVKRHRANGLEQPEIRPHLRLVVSNAVPKRDPESEPSKKRPRKKGVKQRDPLRHRPDEADSFEKRFQWIFERLEARHPEMSQTSIAEKYGLDGGQAVRMQDGDRGARVRTLIKFCQKSRANPTYLVLGEGADFL